MLKPNPLIIIGIKVEPGPLGVIPRKGILKRSQYFTSSRNSHNCTLEVRVSNSRVVCLQTGYGNIALALCESACIHRVRREIEQKHKGPEDGDNAGHDVHIFPGSEWASLNLTQSAVDQGEKMATNPAIFQCLVEMKTTEAEIRLLALYQIPILKSCSPLL